jgi:hypothetical protein
MRFSPGWPRLDRFSKELKPRSKEFQECLECDAVWVRHPEPPAASYEINIVPVGIRNRDLNDLGIASTFVYIDEGQSTFRVCYERMHQCHCDH